MAIENGDRAFGYVTLEMGFPRATLLVTDNGGGTYVPLE